MSVVTLEGRAFPSVINVLVDGRLRRYVPLAADPGESGHDRDGNRDSVQKESPHVQATHRFDRGGLLDLARFLRWFVAEHGPDTLMRVASLGDVADSIDELCGEVPE